MKDDRASGGRGAAGGTGAEPVPLFRAVGGGAGRGEPEAIVLPGPPLDLPNDPDPLMDPDDVARAELEALRQRHRDLDAAIEALAERGSDPLAVRRLKKRKLMLRDRIAALEDRLTPDIIA